MIRPPRGSLVLVVGAAIAWLFPLVTLVTESVARGGLGNYGAVMSSTGIFRNILNSTIVSAATIGLVLATTCPAAFAFSKLRFPGRQVLFIAILLGLMLPAGAVLVPFFQLIVALGWRDTYQGLVIPYAALLLPFALLLLKHASDGLPDELLESAVIDGASMWTAFRYVALPLLRPTIVLVVIWTFLGAWNEFLLALLFLPSPEFQTISLVPSRFLTLYSVDLGRIYAAMVLIELPVVLLYLVGQRRFERGLLAGAIR